MSKDHIQNDIEYLAGVLPHRGSNTISEQQAADYLQDRFREHASDVSVEAFHSTDTMLVGAAAWYGEFIFVAILAHWFPWIAFAYGTAVFLLYLIELSGYQTVTRLLPQYESQNVVARYMAPRPRGLVVVTAHYDSGRESPLQEPASAKWVHWAHRAVVLAMFIVLMSCIGQATDISREWPMPIEYVFRWTAGAYLLCMALTLVYIELTAAYARGANDNASGVAALLELARRFEQDPPENLDVWLAATGSNEGGLNGMRRLIGSQDFDRQTTWFINLDRVGVGTLRYVTGEGLLSCYKGDRALNATAASLANGYEATPYRNRGWPTDLLIPLTRGFKAIGITAIPEAGTVPEEERPRDRPAAVDCDRIAQAAAFTEALIQILPDDSSTRD